MPLDEVAGRKNIERYFLAGLVVACMALRLLQLHFRVVMFRDEASFAFLIKHMVDGTVLSDDSFYVFQPLLPIIAWPVAAVTKNPELAGRLVSILLGSLAVLPAYFLAKDMFGRKAAVASAVLTGLIQPLVLSSGSVMAEVPYAFTVLLGTYVAYRTYKAGSMVMYTLFGLVMGMSYLARPEGAVIFFFWSFFLGIIMLGKGVPLKSAATLLAVSVAAFFILAMPYMALLKSHFGTWQLTGKTSVNMAYNKAIADTSPGSYDEKLAKYTQMELQGAGGPGGVAEKVRGIVSRYPGNFVEEMKSIVTTTGYLPFAFAVLGLVLGARKRETWKSAGLLLLSFTPLLFIPMYHVLDRVVLPYAPLVFILSAAGTAGAASLLGRLRPSVKLLEHAALTVILAAVIGPGLYSYCSMDPEGFLNLSPSLPGYYEYRLAGDELKKTLPPDSRIMTRNNMVAFYAGGEYVPFTTLGMEDAWKYIVEKKVDYVVYGPLEQYMRPEMRDLLSPEKAAGRYRLVYWQGEFLVYEVISQNGR